MLFSISPSAFLPRYLKNCCPCIKTRIACRKRPDRIERRGAPFLAKTGKIRSKRPLCAQNKNAKNAPATQQTPPLCFFWVERPGGELASHLSVPGI